jgi:hypothetical protein
MSAFDERRAQPMTTQSPRSALLPAEDQPRTPPEWERRLETSRKTIDVIWVQGAPDKAEPRLIHLRCLPSSALAPLPARQPTGLA